MDHEEKKRVMGLDVGEKTIGIAVSDPTRTLAQPLLTVERISLKKDLNKVRELATKHDASAVIVGMPYHMDGRMSPMAEVILQFCERLKNYITIPIHTWDERFTSQAAERSLIEGGLRREKRKNVIDQIAASLILQDWLDAQKNKAR